MDRERVGETSSWLNDLAPCLSVFRTVAIATSYFVETERRDFSQHIVMLLRFSREQNRVDGFLPLRQTQVHISGLVSYEVSGIFHELCRLGFKKGVT
jgi:hypothetical protein